jgi:hypothetical protein
MKTAPPPARGLGNNLGSLSGGTVFDNHALMRQHRIRFFAVEYVHAKEEKKPVSLLRGRWGLNTMF